MTDIGQSFGCRVDWTISVFDCIRRNVQQRKVLFSVVQRIITYVREACGTGRLHGYTLGYFSFNEYSNALYCGIVEGGDLVCVHLFNWGQRLRIPPAQVTVVYQTLTRIMVIMLLYMYHDSPSSILHYALGVFCDRLFRP